LKKHGIPIDLKDALRKSAAEGRGATKDNVTELRPRTPRRRS
jgi:hypothetical protein